MFKLESLSSSFYVQMFKCWVDLLKRDHVIIKDRLEVSTWNVPEILFLLMIWMLACLQYFDLNVYADYYLEPDVCKTVPSQTHSISGHNTNTNSNTFRTWGVLEHKHNLVLVLENILQVDDLVRVWNGNEWNKLLQENIHFMSWSWPPWSWSSL